MEMILMNRICETCRYHEDFSEECRNPDSGTEFSTDDNTCGHWALRKTCSTCLYWEDEQCGNVDVEDDLTHRSDTCCYWKEM